MKLNKTVFYASALCACFCAPAEEDKPADFAWPMGNFGLDCACSRINEAKKTFADETGISPFYNYYSDAFANTGGLSSGANYTHIMTFGAVADLQKIAGLKGASLTVSGAYNAGDDLSGTIGNFYTISQSAVTGGAMMYELYYTQQICAPWGDTIVVNAGRMACRTLSRAFQFSDF